MEPLAFALRSALRSLRSSPGLSLTATLVLALGIAAPTTMFSIAHGALRSLPVPEPERLVSLHSYDTSRHAGQRLIGYEFLAIQAQQRTLEGVAAYHRDRVDVSQPGDRPERLPGTWITPGGFELLRIGPLLGRTFLAEDAHPGAPPVVIVSDRVWQEHLGGRRDPVGATLRVNGVERTIVGVMPPGFHYPEREQVWLPLEPQREPPFPHVRGGWSYPVFGRLGAGRTLAEARAEVAGVAGHLEAERATNRGIRFMVEPYRNALLPREIRTLLRVMVLLVAFVLLIACANVANLRLARATARTRDTAVRVALGATRRRLVSEHLLEASMVAATGGMIAVMLSGAATMLFARTLHGHDDIGYWMDFRVDWTVLLFAAGATWAAALGAGLVPAFRATGVHIHEALKNASREASAFRHGSITSGLVVAQVALSCGLLIVSGLMIKGAVWTLRHGDFDAGRILTARWELRSDAYPNAESVERFDRGVLDGLAGRAGIRAVALTSTLPGQPSSWERIEIEGGTYGRDEERPRVHAIAVSPGFFDAFGLGLVRGRDFTWQDNAGAPPVIIVNEPFADRFFPGQDPVGRRVQVDRATGGFFEREVVLATVIGVAPHLGVRTAQDAAAEAVYHPLSLNWRAGRALVVATSGDPVALVATVRAAVAEHDADVPLYALDRLDRVLARYRTVDRVFAVLFGAFGFAALLLAAVGLYGLMAFSVSRRTRELGVRMALGARPAQVAWIALSGSIAQLGLGVGLGLGIAWYAAPFMTMMFAGTPPHDPTLFALVVGILILAAAAAAVSPLRRALAADPVGALRAE